MSAAPFAYWASAIILGIGLGIGVSLGIMGALWPDRFGAHVPVLGALYVIGGSLASMALVRVCAVIPRGRS